MMDEFKHCDDYIDDETQPECLRAFLDYARSPAHGEGRGKKPALFADYNGKRVRVVMASRFGDVGITDNLGAEYGYDKRVAVADLSNFSATKTTPPPASPPASPEANATTGVDGDGAGEGRAQ